MHRALFAQLVDWALVGREPSASRVPRQVDGTAVPREEVLGAFAASGTAVALPDVAALPSVASTVAWVSAVDDHGNERAGIRLPEVDAGCAAYTGWNPRQRIEGLPNVLYDLLGSRLAAWNTAGLSPVERVEASVQSLVERRFLLPSEFETVVATALRNYFR